MLRRYLEQLCKELAIEEVPKLEERKFYSLRLGEHLIVLRDLDPGVSMETAIGPCPIKRKEELFIYLMRANLLGQGTGSSRIGMDKDEKILTLSLGLPYELNYQMFRDTIENFVNYLIHWQGEIMKFENQQSVY